MTLLRNTKLIKMFVIFNYVEISFCHDSGKFVDLGQKVNNIN